MLRLWHVRGTLPAVFSLDENGFVVAKRTEIPQELMPATEDAVYSCPEGVLKLIRSTTTS